MYLPKEFKHTRLNIRYNSIDSCWSWFIVVHLYSCRVGVAIKMKLLCMARPSVYIQIHEYVISYTIPYWWTNNCIFNLIHYDSSQSTSKSNYAMMLIIIKASSMKGAILIQFQLWSYIFMTGIPIIKAISVKGAIPIQSQLSDHQKLTLTTIYKDLSWYLNWMYWAISI